MWRGTTGRSYNRAADGTGGYDQWSEQARRNPSQELAAARYAVAMPVVGADDDDNPLPTTGMATAPIPLPPTTTSAAMISIGAALSPLRCRPPLH